MMRKLTKEQVEQLSPEQQDLIGELALEDGRKHRALLAAAKGSRAIHYGSSSLIVVGFLIYTFIPESPYLFPILGALAIIFIEARSIAIDSRIDATNARIDALIELNERESEIRDEEADETAT
ncbi:MAG: hypothetical protein P1U86_16285 [Verrucomicrobiales bacterium]|nr:hypothetical protein [Verrucomicrobiales bacterium]